MPLKIAFIHHTAALYGASKSLINLIEGLKAYDVESHVILQQPSELIKVLEGLGARVDCVPFNWWVADRARLKSTLCTVLGERWFLKKQWDDNENLLRVVEILKSWDVDVIQSNSSVIPVGYFASEMLDLPHIWHLREFIDHYGFHFHMGEERSKQIINSSAACIAISNCVGERYFDSDSPGIKRIISNGVLSVAEYQAVRGKSLAYRRTGSGFVFGMIGMIYPAKGFEIGIRAFSTLLAEFPDARLVIAGGGAVDLLKTLSAQLGVASRVDFLGFVEDPFEFYQTIDALLMCSRKEAMGRVTIEANAACKPVIGYDDGGTSELIEHGKTGLLYRGNYKALADCMKTYLNSPELAREMGGAAFKVARNRFSTENCAAQFHQVVEDVLCSWKPRKGEKRTTPFEVAQAATKLLKQ